MIVEQIPTFGLGLVIASYWIYVGIMILRVGGQTRRMRRMVLPAQRMERFMLLLWVPVVWGWINLPFAAVVLDPNRFTMLQMPAFVYGHVAFTVFRFAALGLALACLLASIHCWRFMGNNWRMAIDPGIENRLMQNGPFALVRHPIYALSISLMLCSAIILPSFPMLCVAAVHITLILIKAHNEESFLRERFGPPYDDYCRRTGRFVPRLSHGLLDNEKSKGARVGSSTDRQ